MVMNGPTHAQLSAVFFFQGHLQAQKILSIETQFPDQVMRGATRLSAHFAPAPWSPLPREGIEPSYADSHRDYVS